MAIVHTGECKGTSESSFFNWDNYYNDNILGTINTTAYSFLANWNETFHHSLA